MWMFVKFRLVIFFVYVVFLVSFKKSGIWVIWFKVVVCDVRKLFDLVKDEVLMLVLSIDLM